MVRSTVCNALLIYPRFNSNSFWNYQATCDLVGARYPAAPLGLITVAAMLPKSWNFRLVNRNTQELTDDDWAWADLVLTGGMLPYSSRLALLRVLPSKSLTRKALSGGKATAQSLLSCALPRSLLGPTKIVGPKIASRLMPISNWRPFGFLIMGSMEIPCTMASGRLRATSSLMER